MQIGMIGLGKMGANMAERLMKAGHECVGYDLTADNVKNLESAGGKGAKSLKELSEKLQGPRVVWVMVPAGKPTDDTIQELSGVLEKGEVVIDGGNSYYRDDFRHAEMLKTKGIHFMDAGTSGGVWGKDRGYCLMIGGPKEAFDICEPIYKALAPGESGIERTKGRKGDLSASEQGYLHCGPVGSGHYVKMVHNGIEYGVMQAYAEGFDILKGAGEFDLDIKEVAEVWRRGSVIGSWLLDLSAIALLEDNELEAYSGHVADSGEGRWTVQAAVESGISAEVLSTALFKRFRSRQENSFAEKILSAMRFQFGGHVEKG
ncbi:MAG: decarboxylating 6-phosphogluconate dehydrogenase [Deltaproteobacteria bacterium]|nr:decarboxylating 6-phosphogluconate dehydrogenase [Deltaproteobacteria bacterium]